MGGVCRACEVQSAPFSLVPFLREQLFMTPLYSERLEFCSALLARLLQSPLDVGVAITTDKLPIDVEV